MAGPDPKSSVLVDESATRDEPRPGPPRPWLGASGWRLDAIVVALYAFGAMAVFGHLWINPGGVVLRDNAQDHALFEWMFQHTAHAIAHGQSPFLAPDLGTPTTANLASNTSLVLPGTVLAPITWLFGPAVTFVIFEMLALAGTATGWYFLFRRRLQLDRTPAAFGGAFCGFAPGMLAQATGHPHVAAQFLVPVMLALVLRLGEAGRTRPVQDGVWLGLAVAAQILIGPEVLAVFALGLLVFVIVYFLQRPAELVPRLRDAWRAAVIAIGVAVAFTAYPLYLMFLSPLAYHDIPNSVSQGDIASFWRYSTLSVAGADTRMRWSLNISEQSAYFGLPLMLAMVGAAVWHWRSVWLRSAAITAAFWCLCALGERVRLHGKDLGFDGPWASLQDKPVLHDIIVTRLSMIAIPIIGVFLAATWQRSMRQIAGPARFVWPLALMLAVAPTVPLPLQGTGRPSVPSFISEGTWRTCVSPGGTLVGYGTQSAQRRVGLLQMRWQTAAGMAYNSPNGYYIARAPDGSGQWGQTLRLTDQLILDAIRNGNVAAPGDRSGEITSDLRYWRADCVVIEQRVQNSAAVLASATAMFGPPRSAGGAWYWDVRARRA